MRLIVFSFGGGGPSDDDESDCGSLLFIAVDSLEPLGLESLVPVDIGRSHKLVSEWFSFFCRLFALSGPKRSEPVSGLNAPDN